MLSKVKSSLHKHFLPPDLHKKLDAPAGVVRPKVWLEVVKGEESYDARRIEIELFSDIVPKTAENFRQLCTGECGRSYERATFHRVVPEFTIQGGDIINGDGTGVWSIYGGPFPDENFTVPHDAKGLVSMANQGPNTNGCQFFITLAPADFLNGKHVAFGRVVGGWDIVKKIAAVPLAGERPIEVIGIVACGGDGPVGGQVAGVPGASDSTLAAGAVSQHRGAAQPGIPSQQPGVQQQQAGGVVGGQQDPAVQQTAGGVAGQQLDAQQQASAAPNQQLPQQAQNLAHHGQQLPQDGQHVSHAQLDQQIPQQSLPQEGQQVPGQSAPGQHIPLTDRFPDPPHAQPALDGASPAGH